MHQSIGKKNKIIIYLLFLFVLSTTSAKLINNQNKLSSSISKINITGLSERKNLEISNNLNNFLYKSIFLISKDEIRNLLTRCYNDYYLRISWFFKYLKSFIN